MSVKVEGREWYCTRCKQTFKCKNADQAIKDSFRHNRDHADGVTVKKRRPRPRLEKEELSESVE